MKNNADNCTDDLINDMSLSKKMDRISSKLSDTLDLSDELDETAEEIIASATSVTSTMETDSVQTVLNTNDLADLPDCNSSTVIELVSIVEDFKFIRSTLKENTINARRLLSKLTLELTEVNLSEHAETITSFSEINKVIVDNMKLYVDAYKGISSSLININKINNSIESKHNSRTNTNNANNAKSVKKISTIDLLNELGEK